ncbi:uncharacterized protein LOC127120407 [Lathyrus oleraceus]|nr:uncharacterized protein LOC127120407 [Pisum sativum]
MSHQFRLVNGNEDGSPTRDARALRYSLAFNSPSLVAFNNRTESARTAASTQVAASTSPFQRNNNFSSSGADSSSSSRSLGWGFDGFIAPQPPPPPPPPSFDPSTNIRLNPPPPATGPEFITAIESDQYVQTETSLTRSRNLPRDNIHILTSTSHELRTQRNRLRNEILSTLQHLRNGGSVRIEDLLILDLSIVLNVLDSQEHIHMLYEEDYMEGEIRINW